MGAIVRHSLLDKRHRTPFVFSTNTAANIIAKCVGFPKAVKLADFSRTYDLGFYEASKTAARCSRNRLRTSWHFLRNATNAHAQKSSRLGPIAMHFAERCETRCTIGRETSPFERLPPCRKSLSPTPISRNSDFEFAMARARGRRNRRVSLTQAAGYHSQRRRRRCHCDLYGTFSPEVFAALPQTCRS